MSSSKPSRSVNLKRAVTVNAVVTDSLKKMLVSEIQESEQSSEQRMAEVSEQAQHLISEARKLGNQSEVTQLEQQLAQERHQFQLVMRELDQRKEFVKTLKLGELFSHGTIEGFVSVQEGDNLYEKLSAATILVEDGVIKRIDLKPGSPTAARIQD